MDGAISAAEGVQAAIRTLQGAKGVERRPEARSLGTTPLLLVAIGVKKTDSESVQVCNMRQSRRMGKMKEERIKKLNELGFLWRCEQTGKVIWEEMIDKLKAFQTRHGHCR